MKRLIMFVLLGICAIGCYAAIYMQTDKQGNVTYTDMPNNSNAQVVNTGFENTVSSQQETAPTGPPSNPVVNNNTTPPSVEITKQPYQTFSIESPTDQESIQNQPSIQVKFNIEPALQSGDMIQLYIDGSPWGAPQKNNEINVNLLDRGTHQLSGKLIDSNNVILKETKTITIFVHRASSNFSPS